MNLLYSFQARGYQIVLLCSVILFYSITEYLQKEGGNKYLVLYSIASIVGYFAIPSFLYPFATVTLFAIVNLCIQRRFILIKQIVVTNVMIGVLVLVEYLPIISISGLKSITGNYYTKPIHRTEVIERLYSHFQSTAQWLTGISESVVLFIIVCILIAVLLYALIAKKEKAISYSLLMFSLMFAPIIVLVHSVIPFERTWVYLSIPLCISSGFLMNLLSSRRIVIYPLMLAVSVGLFFSFSYFHKNVYYLDY
jgi:hypothetical protein